MQADEWVLWAERVQNGDRRAVAKVISFLENQDQIGTSVLKHLYPQTGQAHVIGLTGPPGGGKSSLVDRIIQEIRNHDYNVAVIAVDPTSPFTGGAILGDRIRMQRWADDSGVFIRSMGTRGSLGGLARAAYAAVQLLDAASFPYILVETVGVGQSEVDIVQIADTVVVTSVPGLGDDIQVSKAGIMEIGDLFVVNKADLPGSGRVVAQLESMLELGLHDGWIPPVIPTVATSGEGVPDLVAAIKNHMLFLQEKGLLPKRRLNREKKAMLRRLMDRIRKDIVEHLLAEQSGQVWKDLAAKQIDPYTLENKLYSSWKGCNINDNAN